MRLAIIIFAIISSIPTQVSVDYYPIEYAESSYKPVEAVVYEEQSMSQVIAEKPQETVKLTPSVAVSGSCTDWIIAAGVTDVANATYLIMKESGCNPNARNPSSGACGIPQALPCSKLGTSDPVAQIRWMQNYVFARYGSWASAVSHSKSVGWY